MKALGVFLRYFMHAYRGPETRQQKPKANSKYKDAEEVDFIEIKEDKNNTGEKS